MNLMWFKCLGKNEFNAQPGRQWSRVESIRRLHSKLLPAFESRQLRCLLGKALNSGNSKGLNCIRGVYGEVRRSRSEMTRRLREYFDLAVTSCESCMNGGMVVIELVS